MMQYVLAAGAWLGTNWRLAVAVLVMAGIARFAVWLFQTWRRQRDARKLPTGGLITGSNCPYGHSHALGEKCWAIR